MFPDLCSQWSFFVPRHHKDGRGERSRGESNLLSGQRTFFVCSEWRWEHRVVGSTRSTPACFLFFGILPSVNSLQWRKSQENSVESREGNKIQICAISYSSAHTVQFGILVHCLFVFYIYIYIYIRAVTIYVSKPKSKKLSSTNLSCAVRRQNRNTTTVQISPMSCK